MNKPDMMLARCVFTLKTQPGVPVVLDELDEMCRKALLSQAVQPSREHWSPSSMVAEAVAILRIDYDGMRGGIREMEGRYLQSHLDYMVAAVDWFEANTTISVVTRKPTDEELLAMLFGAVLGLNSPEEQD